jgi:hypothetical protein
VPSTLAAPPEAALLFTAAALAAGHEPACLSAGADLRSGEVRWPEVLHLSQRHGLDLWVHRLINRIDAADHFKAALRDRLSKQQQRNLHLTSLMVQALAAFENAQVPVAAYKGPMLALELYNDVGARAMSDLDFLIAPADADRANQVLLELGFRRAPDTATRAPTTYEDVFLNDDGYIVELQWRLTPHYLPLALTVDELLARRRRIQLGSITAPVLAAHDLLLALALHGGKHLWERLSWLADFLACARIHCTADDWPALLQRARSLRILRIVLLPFALGECALGIEPPTAVAAAISRDGDLAPVVDHIATALAGQRALPETGSFAYFREVWRLRESMRDRVNGRLRLAFTPGPSDIAAVSLPARWHRLYPLVRAGRLAARLSGFSRPARSLASD